VPRTRPSHVIATLRRAACALAVLAPLLAPGGARAAELGVVTDLTWGAAAADQEREYALLSDLGARWIRVEVNWAEVEPARGRYHAWSLGQIDAAVRRNRAAGRRVVILIGKAPRWASGSADQGSPPRDPADYARFAAMLARRYAGDGIAGYEIWNEPNIGRFWGGRPDAAAYVRLLRAAGGAIRAADPRARIVFGGLSTNDVEYVRAAYAAGAKGQFDVMALHPYSCETRVERGNAPGSFLGYRAVRAFMAAQDDRRPMWFTEFGWSTNGERCGVSERAQAANLRASVQLMARDRYVKAAMLYALRNPYWMHDADTTEAQYGLLTTGFRPKLAYAAFRALAHERIRVRAGRVRRGRVRVSGRVSAAAARRVRVTLRRGHRRIKRVAAVRRSRFQVRLPRVRAGRWRVVASVAGRPHVRAARTLLVH
jgi:polysaccharide biosynthesis protein PslG